MNDKDVLTIDSLKLKIQELENKINAQNKINELVTKNINQFDKNLKTMNEDFSVLAAAISQIFQIFIQLKVIKISDIKDGINDDLLDPEPINDTNNLNLQENQNNEKVEEEDDFDINNLESIIDWDSFREKHKKKFQ